MDSKTFKMYIIFIKIYGFLFFEESLINFSTSVLSSYLMAILLQRAFISENPHHVAR